MGIECAIWLLIACLFGLLAGYAIARYKLLVESVGDLRIDRSDPDGVYLFLELETDINTISKRKFVTLRTKNEDFVSRN